MTSVEYNPNSQHSPSGTSPAALHRLIFALVMALGLASCGEALADGDHAGSEEPISDTTEFDQGIAEQGIEFESSDGRGADPFAPAAEIVECQAETLIDFLGANARIASAWADAGDVGIDEIAATIRSLKPATLERATRVTNHAYRGGRARAFQAPLAEGTAVLVDDFCSVWAHLAPLVVGGPTDASPAGVEAYLAVMAEGFGRVVAAGQNTIGFPADALTDLEAYHEALLEAAAAGTPGEGDVGLRDRVEDFLLSYCGRAPIGDIDDTVPTHLDPPVDAVPDEGTPSGSCGSLQFFLLVAAADGLGLDHAAVSGLYIAALDAVLAGTDPGPSFDVADLSPMVAYEDVGCAGAQAMQQLFADVGMAHVIDGTELGA